MHRRWRRTPPCCSPTPPCRRWHEAYPQLPFVFAGSALASGAGVGLIAAGDREVGPAERLAVIGAGMELLAARSVRHNLGLLSEPYTTGRPGRLLHAGEVLTSLGVAGALLGRRSRAVRALSGLSLLTAAAVTRFGIFEGGVASTEDPKYVVVAAARAAGGARSDAPRRSRRRDRGSKSSPTTG